jgi:hypothetical protein
LGWHFGYFFRIGKPDRLALSVVFKGFVFDFAGAPLVTQHVSGEALQRDPFGIRAAGGLGSSYAFTLQDGADHGQATIIDFN